MKTIALFFGGLSNEAEVSIMSAKNIVNYFDYRRHHLVLIYWHKSDRRFYLIDNINNIVTRQSKQIAVENFSSLFDVALLMTHGRYGEDGILQAILEGQGVRYCGCGVLSSALCMDKVALKTMFSGQGIRQVHYEFIDLDGLGSKELKDRLSDIGKKLKLPLYVKPANSGSSVGITKVKNYDEMAKAVRVARRHDKKILFEEGLINPIELEIGIMGNNKLLVSRPGQLRLVKDFYDYDDKYKKGEAQTIVPAKISAKHMKQAQAMAIKAYRLAGCRGFARIDFFLFNDLLYLNEINTLPGFTDISMFPLVMMDQGMSYRQLINKIISLA